MKTGKIRYLDIHDNFYVENDIVKVKINESNEQLEADCSIDDIWDDVRKIIIKIRTHFLKMEKFSFLNNLNEEQKIKLMKTWDKATWTRFCMQNTVSEQEVFDPIMKLIEEDDDRNRTFEDYVH